MQDPKNTTTFSPDDQVVLGFPTYNAEMKTPFAMSLINLLMSSENPVAKIDVIANDSLVSRARNTIAARFLEAKHPATGNPLKWLLFIDSDIEFQHQHVSRILNQGKRFGDQAIVCGMYALKQVRPHFVANSIPGAKVDEEGCIEVREGGTGFMLIHRSVFEKMIEQFPEIEFVCDQNEANVAGIKRWDFFTVGVYHDKVQGVRRYLSEDYYFCQRWRDMGGKVIMDTRIQAKHHGNMTFPIPAKEIADAHEVYLRAAKLIEEKTKKE